MIAKLIGAPDPSTQNPFSVEVIEKAAKEFQQLSIQRGEWIVEYDLDKYIKKAPHGAGKFIREHFSFTSFFKRGSRYYFYKEDVLALAKELKDRNVDLRRYMELKEDQARFEKYLTAQKENNKGKKKRKAYHLPAYVKNFLTAPPVLPGVEIVREDLKALKQEFFEHKLGEYVDIYKGNYALLKYLYPYERYIAPEIRKRAKDWCDHFNIANRVLQEITKKKETFIPIEEEKMIQL